MTPDSASTTRTQTTGPLVGIRVLDLGIMGAGPWTSALLGILGADVIKVESPSGDLMRKYEPTQRGMGTNFIVLNLNKKSIVLDLKDPSDNGRAVELASICDVFLQNFRVGTIDKLGLDYESVRKLNPRAVYCSISGFGETGPLAKAGCIDTIMQAFSGFASINGAAGGDFEAFRFTSFIDLVTGSVAAEAVLAALLERDATGVGQKVEVSMLEAALEIQFTRIAELLGGGELPRPRGSESAGLVPDRGFAALDREIFVTAHNEQEWNGFCNAAGRPDLAADPRFASNPLRVYHRDALNAELEPLFRERPAIWWLRAMQRNGVPAGLAHDFEMLRHHRQVVDNGMIAQLASPAWGDVWVGGLPWRFSRTPCAARVPESFGTNVNDALSRSGTVAARTLTAAGISGLKGLKVVEFAEGVAGPLAALRLSDLGAEVTKIETPQGDWLRGAAPMIPGTTMSAAFAELNRGKRPLALERGQRPLLPELLREADVFITDRTAAELRELGVDGIEGETFASNPRLVVASLSSWGERGPLRDRKGSELTAQAMAGYTRYLGVAGGPAQRLGADVASVSTGVFACQAVLAALLERNTSGRGQRVALSLLNSLLTLKTVHIAAQGDPDTFTGPRAGGAFYPPDRGWKTANGRIWMMFGGAGTGGRTGWVDFVREVGLAHLVDDARFEKNGRNSTGHGLMAHELHAEYEAAFVRYSSEDLVSLIRKHLGNVAIFQDAKAVLEHPQTHALDIVRSVPSGAGPEIKVRAFPAHFSGLEQDIRGHAPRAGGA